VADGAQSRIEVRLRSEARGTIAYITVRNEAKLNTLDRRLMRDLIAEVEELEWSADLRAIVLSGAGERAFIGGANIGEMAALDAKSAKDYITLVHRTCRALRRSSVPVIARIDGYAIGAGLEVAVSCDLRVATTRSKFGMPEVKVGIPSVVEAALIPRLVGWGRARELLLLGETIDAETALRWGLIERMVAPAALDAEIDKVLESLLTAGAQAVRRQKALMREWEKLPTDRAIALGIDAFVRAFDTDEPKRMLSAFLERKR
jgi:enoyl-CoA hydratase/carnithine racemase